MGGIISKLLFQPPKPPSYTDNNDGRIIWLTCKGKGTKDPATNREVPVKIPSVFLSYKGSDLCLLYSHGNATDLGQMMPYLELLRSSLKINVFSYEYQGYGICTPKVNCSEQRCYASIEAAVDYLMEVKNFTRSKIIVFGTSLGSGPSIYIASKYSSLNPDRPKPELPQDDGSSFRGIILQSPFTSVVRIKVKTPQKLFFDMFANVDRVAKVDCPVFIIHGKVDEVVPFEHATILSEKLSKPYKPLFIEYAGHNNIMEILSVERYIKKIFEFIVYLNNMEQQTKQQQQQQQQPSLQE